MYSTNSAPRFPMIDTPSCGSCGLPLPDEKQRLCRRCHGYGMLRAVLKEALRDIRDERPE